MPGPPKRACLLGGESTGKTTLARALADEYGTVWNPEFGRAYTEIGRDPERTVDERGVHAHRQDPVLVRGPPGRLGSRRALLRHGRLHDGAVSSGLSRRTDARLRRAARAAGTTSTSSAGSTFRGGTTGSGSSTTSGSGCTTATWSEPERAGRRGSSSRARTRSDCGRESSPSIACSKGRRHHRRALAASASAWNSW